MKNFRRAIVGHRNRKNGFTLVELLVALSILSFGLLSVASLLLTAVTLNLLGKSTNEATAYAREKIEYLKTLPSADSQRANGGSLVSDVSGYSDMVGAYYRRWQISTGPASTQIYRISVLPVNPDARTKKSVTMTTIF